MENTEKTLSYAEIIAALKLLVEQTLDPRYALAGELANTLKDADKTREQFLTRFNQNPTSALSWSGEGMVKAEYAAARIADLAKKLPERTSEEAVEWLEKLIELETREQMRFYGTRSSSALDRALKESEAEARCDLIGEMRSWVSFTKMLSEARTPEGQLKCIAAIAKDVEGRAEALSATAAQKVVAGYLTDTARWAGFIRNAAEEGLVAFRERTPTQTIPAANEAHALVVNCGSHKASARFTRDREQLAVTTGQLIDAVKNFAATAMA